jgi:hypothetical protein
LLLTQNRFSLWPIPIRDHPGGAPGRSLRFGPAIVVGFAVMLAVQQRFDSWRPK